MSSNLVPFDIDNAALPAHLAELSAGEDDLTAGVGGGYPVISIKSKVFHIARGQELELVAKADGDPASALEVVILKANPRLSKIYYKQGYVEGSTDKPTCYSHDSITPATDAQERQAASCAACPHDVWGSRISEAGKQGKACADARRLAVAPAGQLNDAMLIRVPAASLATLQQYGERLKKRGVKYPGVITRIGFDYTVAHPALTFKPVAFVSTEMAAVIKKVIDSEIVSQIVGAIPSARAAEAAAALPAPAAAAAPVQPVPAAAVAAPKPVKPAKPTVVKPVAAVAAQPAPAKPNPFAVSGVEDTQPVVAAGRTQPVQAAATVANNPEELDSALDKVLAGAGLDDV